MYFFSKNIKIKLNANVKMKKKKSLIKEVKKTQILNLECKITFQILL